jgi:hypothetical protein
MLMREGGRREEEFEKRRVWKGERSRTRRDVCGGGGARELEKQRHQKGRGDTRRRKIPSWARRRAVGPHPIRTLEARIYFPSACVNDSFSGDHIPIIFDN